MSDPLFPSRAGRIPDLIDLVRTWRERAIDLRKSHRSRQADEREQAANELAAWIALRTAEAFPLEADLQERRA